MGAKVAFNGHVTTNPPHALALTAVLDPWLPDLLRRTGYTVIAVGSGADAREQAAQMHPDLVVLDAVLEDMSGAEACRLLRSDPDIVRHLPILILYDGQPTPELRVAALRVGAWDFLSPSIGDHEVLLKVATYVEAKRTVADAVDEGFLDPSSGFCSLPGLARRARSLSALMTRVSGPLACVVIEVEGRATLRDLGGVVARAARISDVVGDLGANRMGILAPGTTAPGAIRLAQRVAEAITQAIQARPSTEQGAVPAAVAAGFDVVTNAKYSPVDPFELLHRAAAAVRHGQPSAEAAWVRRFTDASSERRSPPAGGGTMTSFRPPASGVTP